MSKRTPLYEGKAKVLYEGPEPGTLIQHFKDDATAFNNQKRGTVIGKGILNNRISEYLMLRLEEMGIETHFIKALNMREQLVKAVDIIPVEVVVRNVTAGSLAKRFGVEEGMALPRPLIEFYLKSDELGDPMVSEEHIMMFGWADPLELEEMKVQAIRVNDFLSGLFLGVGIKLVDFKLEFGRIFDEDGNVYIILADEISPDNCRLWDIQTGNKMDKDRFRHDMGGVEEAYQEVAKRLGVLVDPNKPVSGDGKPKKVGKKAPVKTGKTIKSPVGDASNNNDI
ncbi:MAG: phosphoribosylaminoimidazolesuccinocarboxamide synthase [Alphaproteobacteria bacterium]|nr:phosphoribosylaminoimidazolesuccinocarboxamide synthase [Alphaproteobacteria bacterium]